MNIDNVDIYRTEYYISTFVLHVFTSRYYFRPLISKHIKFTQLA